MAKERRSQSEKFYPHCRLYYGDLPEHLHVCTSQVHALLHIPHFLRVWGPMWLYWAYPMERIVGSLDNAARSRIHPYSSLQRSILLREQLHNIPRLWDMREVDTSKIHNGLAVGDHMLNGIVGDWELPSHFDQQEITRALSLQGEAEGAMVVSSGGKRTSKIAQPQSCHFYRLLSNCRAGSTLI